VTGRDDELRLRPGRVRDRGQGSGRPQSFVHQVIGAARRAGHTGPGLGSFGARSRSGFGRGRAAAARYALRSPSRRVVVKARVARHRGTRFRSAPLAKHLSYLQRDGVTRDGGDARMFDARGDAVGVEAFAARCEDDRHHFRFIVSPEDAAEMEDLRAFTRDLMARASKDLGTDLDWVAVDHWNTDQPHVHVLVRGRGNDGSDLVISREYISQGLRGRAEELVGLELGPRSEHAIRSTLEREVGAERWTSLDRALRATADDGAGVADLRPGGEGDPELRRLLVGRAQTLERLGLAEPVGPAQWTLKADVEPTLRALGERGDIIKTMHRALSRGDRVPDPGAFAIHGDEQTSLLGRLADRGLHDELKGSAYVVIDGVDGRAHHIRFGSLEATGDAQVGAIVEARPFTGSDGRQRLSLATRSDLPLEAQVTSAGATWLDRNLVAREPPALANGGFGVEVREALERRTEHLASQGLARRAGQRALFARDLLETLGRRELDSAANKITAETGLPRQLAAEGEHVAGVYRQRVQLASGRFAMIDNGLGFELVPWKPALEVQIGRQVSGVVLPGGGVDWSFGRKRGLGL
jgi:type IV secretory pathway VirD2 relaxase